MRARKNKDDTCSFLLMKRMAGKASPLRLQLGVWPDMTIDDAEAKATQYRKLIADGIDPRNFEKEKRQTIRAKKKADDAKAVTLRQLLDEYQMSRKSFEKGNAPKTLRDGRNCVLSVWEPWLDISIQNIDGNDLLDHYHYWTSQRKGRNGTPARSQIKKGVRILSSLFNYAINQKDYISVNPCNKFKNQIPLSSNRKEYYLEPKETCELFEWLGRIASPASYGDLVKLELTHYELGPENATVLDAIALQLLTGLRQHEILHLPWKDVYLSKDEYSDNSEGPYFRITTSKQKRPFGIPITPEMAVHFERRKVARVNDFVFPSPRPSEKIQAPIEYDRTAYATLNKLMPKLRNAPRMSANVMRHTFATCSYTLYQSFEITDMITGHISGRKNSRVATDRYVHIQADHHRKYFEEINETILGNHDLKGWDEIPLSEKEQEDELRQMMEHSARLDLPPPQSG